MSVIDTIMENYHINICETLVIYCSAISAESFLCKKQRTKAALSKLGRTLGCLLGAFLGSENSGRHTESLHAHRLSTWAEPDKTGSKL